MLMEMHMKEIGIMIKPKEEELMNTLMVQNILVNGKKTVNMVMGLKHGQIMQNMKEIMNMERSMALVLLNGLMGRPM